MKTLTVGNPKTVKGEKQGYLTFILHLAPAKLSGYELCPDRSPACTFLCLNTAGRGGIFKKGENTNAIQKARIRKTKAFMEERNAFMRELVADIERGIAYARKRDLIPVFRLNGTSDVQWEYVPAVRGGVYFRSIIEAFPEVQFYDYTKTPNRQVPSNYDLTFSLSEKNRGQAELALLQGYNVAAVFDAIPETFMGYPVLNGDESDLRFKDARAHIVGLKAKGRARKDQSGFVNRGTK